MASSSDSASFRRAHTDTNRSGFAQGLRLGLGPGAATLALGLSFGAAASAAGWGTALPLLFSMFAFSGSAQFALLATLPSGGAVAAVAAATLINARYLVMGIALNDSLRGGRLWRAVQAQALVDASFGVSHLGAGRFDIGRLVGASVPQWLCWVIGTAAGLLAQPSPEVLRSLGVDVIFPAFFLVLVLEEVRHSRLALLGAASGAAIAAALLFIAQPGYALLAATAGALVGVLPGRAHDDGGEAE